MNQSTNSQTITHSNLQALVRREERILSTLSNQKSTTENLWPEIRIQETAETYFLPLLFSFGVFVGMAMMIMSK